MRSKKGALKHTTYLATALILALATSACGGGTAGTTDAGGNGSQQTDAIQSAPEQTGSDAAGSEAPEEIVEITVYDKPHADQPDRDQVEKTFAEFDALYPNIKVTHIEELKGKEREQFMTAVAGGEQPDLSRAAFPSMELYISQGLAADITDLWNDFEDKDNYLPSSLTAGTKDGKIYGFPREMYVTGLMYNKRMFEAAGLDPNQAPKDWNEFVEYGKKLTDPSKNTYGYALLGMDWADWFFEYYVWQAGGDLTQKNDDGTVTLTFTSEPTVTALQFYKDLKWTHKITQSNVVQSLEDNQKDFYTGRAAMTIGGGDSFNTMVTKGMSLNDIGFGPLPAGPSGTSPSQVGGSYWVFSPKSTDAQRKAAFTYVSYLGSKKKIEEHYQNQKDNGIVPNMLSVRTDIDIPKYVEGLPSDIVTGVQNASENPRLEYFLKDRLSPYVVKAIQKVLLDENADPLAELQEAQDLAQKEVVDKYNAELKK